MEWNKEGSTIILEEVRLRVSARVRRQSFAWNRLGWKSSVFYAEIKQLRPALG